MTEDFATALRRALQKTRTSDPAAATAIIQAALSGKPSPDDADGGKCGPCDAFAEARGGARRKRAASAFRRAASGVTGLPEVGGLPRPGRLVRGAGLGRPAGQGLSGFGSAARPARRAPVPDGARVEMLRHDVPGGGRDYRLFIPSAREGGPVGLVLMLHGCTQTPEDFALGARMDVAAESAGFVVAYPGQTGAHNMQGCWNWFRPEDQTREGGEPAVLASLATRLAERFDLGGRVHVAGLSAGGAMAAVLAETHPDVFAAAGIHSGLPAGAAQDVPSAFAAMRGRSRKGTAPALPVIVFHGTADRTVSPRNASALVRGDGVETRHEGGGRCWSRLVTQSGSELWLVEGAGHAWFGGDAGGSYADPAGPDASAEMLRFFEEIQRR